MSIRRNLYWVILSLCVEITFSALLFSEASKVIPNNNLSITIDTDLNLVYIELMITKTASSPLFWSGFGFGSAQMMDTYSIIIDYTFPDQKPIVFETTLGDHSIGSIYATPHITVISDTYDGIHRRIHLQRPISGTYTFPTTPTPFNIISAIGKQSNFRECTPQRQAKCQHNGWNTMSLVLRFHEPTSTPIHTSIHPTEIPTINPTHTPSIEPTLNPSHTPSFTPTSAPTMSAANPSQTPSFSPTINDEMIICDADTPCTQDIICFEGDCRVICDSDASCAHTNIYDVKAHSLFIECNGVSSCKNANIFGGNLLFLIVKCNGFESCKDTHFYGNNTNLLSIYCLHPNGSCPDMDVFCPSNGCVISSDGKESNDVHSNLNLYSLRGFDGLDWTQYVATAAVNKTSNTMHCGYHYQSNCNMNGSLFCHCHYDDYVIVTTQSRVTIVITMCAVLVIILTLIVIALLYGYSHQKANHVHVKTATPQRKKIKKTKKILFLKRMQSIEEEDEETDVSSESSESEAKETNEHTIELYPLCSSGMHSIRRAKSVPNFNNNSDVDWIQSMTPTLCHPGSFFKL
eukprot:635913_1